MTYRTAAARQEEPTMYTEKQSKFANSAAVVSCAVGVGCLLLSAWSNAEVTSNGGTDTSNPQNAIGFAVVAILAAAVLAWSLRVQWRYAGQRVYDFSEGKSG